MTVQSTAARDARHVGAHDIARFSVEGAHEALYPYIEAYDRFLARWKRSVIPGRDWSLEPVGAEARFTVRLPITVFAGFLGEVAKIH